jgi:aspartyl/asparaginyl beta-hydroxylase (cupin superfamily)
MTWQEGKCIVFDDTFRHESWNKSNTLRVVLMLDFVYNGDSSVRNQDFLVAAKLMEGRYSQNTKGSEQNDALITKDLMEALKMFGKVSNVKEQTF